MLLILRSIGNEVPNLRLALTDKNTAIEMHTTAHIGCNILCAVKVGLSAPPTKVFLSIELPINTGISDDKENTFIEHNANIKAATTDIIKSKLYFFIKTSNRQKTYLIINKIIIPYFYFLVKD